MRAPKVHPADEREPTQFGWIRGWGVEIYLPSPEEIRTHCEAFRATWSHQELLARSNGLAGESDFPTHDAANPH
jgi:hypothetical protein